MPELFFIKVDMFTGRKLNLLYVAAFASGTSAIIFEIVWLSLAGLTFGNGVWATSLVLASFMGGIAVGNVASAQFDRYEGSPLKIYVILEISIACSGFLLVLAFPRLTSFLVPLFRSFTDNQFIVNLLRFLTAFILLLIPASAIGATLPFMLKALKGKNELFGRILGKIYAWNTFGSVAGALMTGYFLIKCFGIVNTGLIAALLNVFAASVGYYLFKKTDVVKCETLPSFQRRSLFAAASRVDIKLLAAGFLSGAVLLSLEVVWFRFLSLFFHSHIYLFGIMLAVILAGISAGGLLASRWVRSNPQAVQYLPHLAFTAGLYVPVSYFGYAFKLKLFVGYYYLGYFFLMFPVSLLSGIIFTFLGELLFRKINFEIKTAGLLTCANTVGATIGSLAAGLLLIPVLGMEKSFFYLSVSYGLLAILTMNHQNFMKHKMSFCSVSIVFVAAVALFPFGLMEKTFLPVPLSKYKNNNSAVKLVAVREGLTETIQYLQISDFGEPSFYRLITNSHSMAGTDVIDRRYMKMFVYLPMALNQKIQNALLICFGTGSTAKALTDMPDIRSLDVVDISKDILELSTIVYKKAQENPLSDARVKVHIEDGRYFLQTTDKLYDLITAEPPPPWNYGVANLYTQEHFKLIHDHLTEGGIVSYWLPANQLKQPETLSILKAFCNVFDDCSVWSGAGLELIMIGRRPPRNKVTDNGFSRLWEIPSLIPELTALGLETPEQLAATLIADAAILKQLTQQAQPLTDNYPLRLGASIFSPVDPKQYSYWQAALETPVIGNNVPVDRGLVPEQAWNKSIQHAESQKIINDILLNSYRKPIYMYLHYILTKTQLKWPVLNLLFSDNDVQLNVDKAISKKLNDEVLFYQLAIRYLSVRDFKLADQFLKTYQDMSGQSKKIEALNLRIYISFLVGDKMKSEKLLKEYMMISGKTLSENNSEYWKWLKSTFVAAHDLRLLVKTPVS